MLEVDLLLVADQHLLDGFVDEVGDDARYHHHDAHGENPDQQQDLRLLLVHSQQNERDQRDARDAVSLEAVRAGADRVTGVVARAIGDHARVARVVFLHLEHDLHQIGANVGDLGEDAAGDAQRRSAQGLADGEADEARAGVVTGHEQQNHQHQQAARR